MTFLTAPLVSPASAQSFYGSATTHTNSFASSSNASAFSGQPPEIVETARALKNDPDLIYEFVHNQIEVEYAFGERKGALGALIDRSGTPFDQNVLFVNLVRQAGYSAEYVVAPVTIAASDFFNWTGVSDIQAACRLLSSGGIPAAFNGGSSPSDCTQIGTGAFSTVSILHVYSKVSIGGVWYAYDPSFKAHTTAAPINLLSASGLSSGQAAAAAAASIDSGTVSGAPYIHNASTSGIDGYLQARGAALLGYINANVSASDMDSVVGITKVLPTYKPTGGWRNSTPPGYTTSGGVTLTGDMPDQYRTKLSVTLFADYSAASNTSGFNVLGWPFFVDDIDGRRIGIDTNFDATHVTNPDPNNQNNTSPYTTQAVSLVVDDVPLQSFSCQILVSGSSTCLPGRAGQLTLAIHHPYAANSGTYASATIVKNLVSLMVPVAIVSGWGSVSPTRLAKWSNEAVQDKALPSWSSPPFPCGAVNEGEVCWEQYASSAGDFTKQKLAANWLAQMSRMLAVQSAIANSVGDHQHSVGVVAWRYYPYQQFQYPAPVAGGYQPPYHVGILDQFTSVDVDTALTLTNKTNSATTVNALARSVALSAATLEGSIIEQTEDLPDTATTASRFAWGNLPDNEDPCFTSATPRRFYDFTGTTSSTRTGLYQYEGSASGCSADPSIEQLPASNLAAMYSNPLESAVAAYVAAGFHITTSAESFLGPGARFGPAEADSVCQAQTGNCAYFKWNFPSRQRGGALVATQLSTAGVVLQVAHALTDVDGISKGGGGKQPERFAAYDPAKAADILKDRFVDKSVLLGVDLKTGAAGYTTPTLISQGSGSTPYQLDYKLEFKAAPWAPSLFGPSTGPISGGWNQSWDIRFSNSGSAQEAMGATSPKAAAGTLAAFLVMQDIFTETDRSNVQQDVYAALAADWWRQQMVANVATINRGFSGEQYVRLVDGTWMAPIGSPGILTQTGTRAKLRDDCVLPLNHAYPYATARRWDFSGVTFSLKKADGQTLGVSPWSWNYDPDNKCAITYGYQPKSWTWPQGPSLSFTYDDQQGVTGVTTSLGRSMTFPLSINGGPTGGPLLTAVANGVSVGQQVGSSQVKDAASETWNFNYTAQIARSLTSYNRPVPYIELSQVFEPVNASKAALAYTYDTRGTVKTAQDATSIQAGTRGPYSWFIAEGGRGERDDPLGGAYAIYYDTDGNAVRHIDELGREVDSLYDGRHRVTSRSFPESDQEQFAYDSLDNVTGLTKVAKPGSGLGNIAVSATYDPTWNKLASITDAMGHTTNFTYYASGAGASLMSQAQRPADPSGNRPTYTFQYSSIGLPSQEVDATGVTTTHTYDSYGNLTATTEAAAALTNGQPALNLTTNYMSYTAQGDSQTIQDPRGDCTAYGFDPMRRKSAEGRYTVCNLPWLAYTALNYDLNGRELSEYRATGFDANNNSTGWELTQTGYTPTGKVATKTDPLNHVTTTTYDALDRVSQITDPTGLVTGFTYDAAGQKLQELHGVGTSLAQTYATFTYTPDGLAASEADARGNTITSSYDGFNRLYRTGYVDGTFEQSSYDPNSDLTIWTNRGGFSIVRCYDSLNRKVSEQGVTGATNSGACPTGGTPNTNSRWYDIENRTYTYDLASRPLTADDTWGNHYTYDAAGRLITYYNNFGNTGFGYDAAGNKVYVSYPIGNSSSYTYDSLNRVTSASFNSTTVATLSYDTLSRRTGVTFGDASTESFGYDADDRLTFLSHVFPNGPGSNVSFTYGYDAAGRTTSTTVSNPAFANVPSSQTTSYATADGLNRYPSVNGQTLVWWPEGPLQQDGTYFHNFDETNAHVYSSFLADGSQRLYAPRDANGLAWVHQTFSVAANITSSEYESSSGDRPENLEDRLYTQAPGSNSSTYVGDRQYVLGPDPDERFYISDINGAGYYPHVDRQGSTIALSTAGQDVLTRTYGPYGEIQQSVTQAPGASAYPYLYTGQYYMPWVAAYDYKARTYSASLGRFLQPDIIGPADDLNLFGYTHNDPLNNIDPTGQASFEVYREILFPGSGIYHTFVVQAQCMGCAVQQRYSYGPQHDTGALGSMVEQRGSGSKTDLGDAGAMVTLGRSVSATDKAGYSMSAVKLTDTDQTIAARGAVLDITVGTKQNPGSYPYAPVPEAAGGISINSNTGAQYVAHGTNAAAPPVPGRGGMAPGAGVGGRITSAPTHVCTGSRIPQSGQC